MSTRHYSGEYLVMPAPLHMGLNWCTHACFYCFANLNRPGRRADYSALSQFLGKYHKRQPGKDIAAWLALQGHPIVASNDSDPFAKSNAEQNQTLMREMMDAGLRFVFQTRGGDGAGDMLAAHPPTMVYISFTTDQESTRKAAEPGAPSFEARKALAAHAKACGHFVVAGLNPFYPPWWDDIHGFLDWLADTGIHHAWIGEPHLNYMQARAMPEKVQQRFATDIAYFKAGGSQRPAAWPSLRAACTAVGINTFAGTTSAHGNFWDPYFALGYPFWPTLEGWFDHLRQHGQAVGFTFDAFNDWADTTNGFRSSAFKEYLSGIGRSIRNIGGDQKANTLREVHQFLWQLDQFPTRLRHDDIYIGTQDGHRAVDDSGRFVLVYAPDQTDNTTGRFDIDEADDVLGLEEEQGEQVEE